MIDSLYLAGQGLMGGMWPTAVWPVLWTLIKIVAVLLPLMGCVAYLTLWERKAIGFIDPAKIVHHIHAKRAARCRAKQRCSTVFTYPIGRSSVTAVNHFTADRIKNFERRHNRTWRQDFNNQTPTSHCVNLLGPIHRIEIDQT